MTEAKLTYVAPLQEGPNVQKRPRDILKSIPIGFLLVVVLPTFIATVYYLLIVSPRYVSEARFIVRAPSQMQPTSFGAALQGVGLAPTQTDAFAVHEYATSYDGVQRLNRQFDLEKMFGYSGIDPLSRYPRVGERESFDSLSKAVKRFVTIGYNSQTGISTLRVEAFRPKDAQALATAVLDGGEELVNKLNDRSAQDTLRSAINRQADAQAELESAQLALTAFRNKERFIDPARSAVEGGELIVGLMAKLAELKAERAQMRADAPQSPQLPALDSRIRAFEAQIVVEREKIVGKAESLAPRIGTYETLMLRQELAARELASASNAVNSAELETHRKKLYLERIASPSLPDVSTEPRRLRSIFTVLLTALLTYGVGWLIWAGVREHRQG